MTEKMVLIPMQPSELQVLIADVVNSCLRDHMPTKETIVVDTDTEQLLNKQQAAKLIGVCTSTIDNHARAGNLTRRYIGKAVRFSRDEVLQLAREKTPRKAGESLLSGKKRRA